MRSWKRTKRVRSRARSCFFSSLTVSTSLGNGDISFANSAKVASYWRKSGVSLGSGGAVLDMSSDGTGFRFFVACLTCRGLICAFPFLRHTISVATGKKKLGDTEKKKSHSASLVDCRKSSKLLGKRYRELAMTGVRKDRPERIPFRVSHLRF